MITNDKTGRKLKEGQVVDVQLMGMFQGRIRKIVDMPIQIPGGQQMGPHVVIDVVCAPGIHPAGFVPEVYIIGEPTPEPKGKLVVDGDFGKSH